MKRYRITRSTGCLVVALSCALFGPLAGAPAPAATARPNVVVFLADDLRPDALGALGHPIVKTPNLDRLARDGFVFRNAYTMGSMRGAVCLPSRTMLLTGRSLFRAENAASGAAPGPTRTGIT